MPGYTYLTDQEAADGKVTGDKDLDQLLAEANELGANNWIIRVRSFTPRRRWFRKQQSAVKAYTLYWYTGMGIEYQVINLSTPEGGSVFHGSTQSREDIANFLMGYINGHQDAARMALEKRDA